MHIFKFSLNFFITFANFYVGCEIWSTDLIVFVWEDMDVGVTEDNQFISAHDLGLNISESVFLLDFLSYTINFLFFQIKAINAVVKKI